MDQRSKEEFAKVVLKAVEIQEKHWDINNNCDGIPKEQAAMLAGADKDMAPFVKLILTWPLDAREAAENIAGAKTRNTGR